VSALLEEIRVEGRGVRTGPKGLPRLLAAPPSAGPWATLAEHRCELGPTPPVGRGPREGLIRAVEMSGLRGRGGAGFPTGTKLRSVTRGRRPVVVVNGSESEPASGKDRFLLSTRPHLVLDGALTAAAAVGAERVAICIHSGAEGALTAVARALGEREALEPPSVDVTIHRVPDRYVTGEARSLVHFLNGGPAVPTAAPPRPFQRGVRGRPTLVQNVETLAHLALINAYGPGWFRELGTEKEPGSRLVTVSGAVERPGVYEIGVGTPIERLMRAAGGTQERASAALVGGYFGSWLDARAALVTRMSDQDLRPLGAGFGSGVVCFLPRETCGLVETSRVVSWLASQTAGQCGPCVYGLAAISRGVRELAVGGGGPAADNLERWADQVEGRGACRFPDGAVRLLRSALFVFADEIALHRRGSCSASDSRPVLPIPERP
jgi:NADH:ubiquinone oxidoreductase subunit F (NADH-binding)